MAQLRARRRRRAANDGDPNPGLVLTVDPMEYLSKIISGGGDWIVGVYPRVDTAFRFDVAFSEDNVAGNFTVGNVGLTGTAMGYARLIVWGKRTNGGDSVVGTLRLPVLFQIAPVQSTYPDDPTVPLEMPTIDVTFDQPLHSFSWTPGPGISSHAEISISHVYALVDDPLRDPGVSWLSLWNESRQGIQSYHGNPSRAHRQVTMWTPSGSGGLPAFSIADNSITHNCVGGIDVFLTNRTHGSMPSFGIDSEVLVPNLREAYLNKRLATTHLERGPVVFKLDNTLNGTLLSHDTEACQISPAMGSSNTVVLHWEASTHIDFDDFVVLLAHR